MRTIVPVLVLACLCSAARAEALDEKKLQALGLEIEKGMMTGHPEVLDGLIDMDAILDEATKGIDTPKDFRTGFIEGVKSKRFAAGIAKQMGATGCYKFLRIRTKGASTSLLFRTIIGGGVNYHEFFVVPKGESYNFNNMVIWLSGERISDMLRRTYLPVAAEYNKGVVEKLLGSEELAYKYKDDMRRLIDLVTAGKAQEAKAVYETLPKELQKDKTMMLMRLRYANVIGGQEYADTLSAFERVFPGDPALLLVSIDAETTREHYDQALNRIDELDKAVGGDPYQNAIRARILQKKGQADKARELIRQVNKDEPSLANAYFVGIELAIENKDWPETAALLTNLEKNTTVRMGDLTQVQFYADFVKTDDYKKWLAERSKK